MSMYCLKDDKTSSDILKRCFTKTDIDSDDDSFHLFLADLDYQNRTRIEEV